MNGMMWIRALCLIVLAVGCKSEKRQLTEDLGVLQDRRLDLVRRLDAHEDAVREAERRLDALRAELASNTTDARGFLAGHPVAAGCIRAQRQTWGVDDAVFANDVIAYPEVIATVCSAGLLNANFKREVDSVVASLRQSGLRAKELTRQIAELQRTIDTQRAEIQNDESAVDQLSVEMSRVHGRLNQ